MRLLNDEAFYPSSNQFWFRDTQHLQAIEPQVGPADGGTTVAISGAYFFNSEFVYCIFGETKVISQYINSNTMLCVTPKFPSVGDYSVMVTSNDVDKPIPSGMQFGKRLCCDVRWLHAVQKS